MLTPSFRRVGDIFLHLPQLGATSIWLHFSFVPVGAMFIFPGEGHFHRILAPAGTPIGINHFLFLAFFLGCVFFLLGLVITSSPDCILGPMACI